MESTSLKSAPLAAEANSKANTSVYWIVTGLFCLQMSFTAYAQLSLPQVADAFTHLFWRRRQDKPAIERY